MHPASAAVHSAARAAALLLACLAATQVQAQTGTQTAALAFGRFAANTGGAVAIRANGSRTRTGGVVLMPSTATPASFSIATTGNQQIIVTLPADGSTALVAGTAQMPVNAFESNRPNGILSNPKQPLMIGAVLQVAPNQRSGNYSGTFTIILEYQ